MGCGKVAQEREVMRFWKAYLGGEGLEALEGNSGALSGKHVEWRRFVMERGEV